MNSKHIKKSSLKQATITIHEMNQLIFWAKVGLKKAKGGSYYPEVLETIKEITKNNPSAKP